VLAANNITTDDKKAVQILGQGIQASLRNHAGKGVQQVGEGAPARWRLTCDEKKPRPGLGPVVI
jgi:hypothetical protein